MELRNGTAATWARVLLIVAAALVAWGQLTAELKQVQRELEAKADRETVTVQYQAIVEQLRLINQRLERLEARR